MNDANEEKPKVPRAPQEVIDLVHVAKLEWEKMIRACEELELVAEKLRDMKPPYSVMGYGMAQALPAHKPERMKKHLENLNAFAEKHNARPTDSSS